jgi:periplasmic copper chaperone A
MTRFLVALGLLVPALGLATAADYKAGPIEIQNPWTRATPKGAAIAAGYVVLINRGSTPDRLVGGSFAGASTVELHGMSMDNGVMRMRPVSGGLEIKPGERVELKPSGLHMMFVGLKQPLQQGQTVKATLVFQNAGTAEVAFAVEGMGGPADQHGGHGH